MDTSSLVMDEIEAGMEFLKRLHSSQPVAAACWLRGGEDEERYLYVALNGSIEDHFASAYLEVRRIAQEMKEHYIDPFRVKLIGENHPVARALLETYRRYPGRVPPRSNIWGL